MSFPQTQIPDFTLITGPNGVGKTHLLQSLHLGLIKTDVAQNQSAKNQTEIRMFDWTTMTPQDTGYFTSESIRNERQALINNYTKLRNRNAWFEPAREAVRKRDLDTKYINDPVSLLRMPLSDLIAIVDGEESAISLSDELERALNEYERNVLSHLDATSGAQLRAVSKFAGKPIAALSDKDILSPSVPSWGQIEIFQQSFARLFVAYRDLLLANTLAQFRASKGQDAEFRSDDDFLKVHGPAPWNFVNRSLSEAGFDFSINHPSLDDYTQFHPKLTKRSTGVEIPFGSLSSGEKILMSFAFCVYYSNDKRQLAVQPKILLLDEIDAPLHPSMSKSIINTITQTLVESLGIKVIATTHSPSTVALAPEDSIYTMRLDQPGLHKSSKADALNILTVGVPTIAISHDGRRQVFVESPTDAKVYDALYKLLRARISSDRSLEFIATGVRAPGSGDQNTGCDVVKKLVSELSNAGNISVFGLLDWDDKHKSSDRIAVLGEGGRNGLENVILDPLLLGLTICREFPAQKGTLGVPDETSYVELLSSDPLQLQSLAGGVARKIFGNQSSHTVDACYVGGVKLRIDSRWFLTDDHRLENLILDAFPFLRAIAKRCGALMEHIIANVLSDRPDLMPAEIRTVIEDLLNRPAHI